MRVSSPADLKKVDGSPKYLFKVTKGNNYKNIELRVTGLLHDTSSYQGLSTYEVSFKLYKNLNYCKIKKCDGESVTDRTDGQTDR